MGYYDQQRAISCVVCLLMSSISCFTGFCKSKDDLKKIKNERKDDLCGVSVLTDLMAKGGKILCWVVVKI